MRWTTAVRAGTGLAAAAVGLFVTANLLFYGAYYRQTPMEGPRFAASLSGPTTNPEAFRPVYPRHFASFERNRYQANLGLRLDVLRPESRLDKAPYLKVLWAGMPVGLDYNEDRGHLVSLDDLRRTTRVTADTTAICLYCHSAETPTLLARYGDSFYQTSFQEANGLAQHSISCSDCHDPRSMARTITRPALTEALLRQGGDAAGATPADFGSLVCGQCHSEYYIDPRSGAVTFPWDRGFGPEAMYCFYDERDFGDWMHPVSGVNLIKVQHPEYEMYQGSAHQRRGLGCADCHMPAVNEGGARISSHWWTSPLNTVEQSCSTCHRGATAGLTQKVRQNQQAVRARLDAIGASLAQVHQMIGQVERSTVPTGPPMRAAAVSKLAEARALLREAQFYWDYVGTENSLGFHNPKLTDATLTRAADLAARSRAAAIAAGAAPQMVLSR